jgi:phytoene dehydrogenase-like protein
VSSAHRVTIAGGGIAGLTAALRLAERGYQVTMYEQKPILGGDLASRPGARSVSHDVYPHMYLNWYHNFWRLLGDVTDARRDELFVPMNQVKQLAKGDFPRFTALTDSYSPWHVLQNLASGVGPVADMFLYVSATVDLLAEHLNPTVLLDELSVNGFLHARPYMTERAAEAFDAWITRVWAIPSYLASAADFQTFTKSNCSHLDVEPRFGHCETSTSIGSSTGAASNRNSTLRARPGCGSVTPTPNTCRGPSRSMQLARTSR